MNREEIKKKWKNKEFVEINNNKATFSNRERMTVSPAKKISTPTNTTVNWNNVINRANQILSNNTRNTNNLVNVENPLLIKSKANVMTEEQAKSIASIDDSKKRFEAISKLSNNRQQYQKNAMQVNTIREAEKSKKKAEKINADIAKGNYLSSVGHILKGLPTEALNAVTKTTVSLANLNPNTKDSKEMMEAGKLLTSRYSDTTSQINNKIVQGASRVSGTIGNMIPSIATGLMGGPAGLVNAINVGGSSYMENLNEEQDNKLKSLLTGTVKGTLSYNIEKLAGGNFLGKGSLDDLAKMGISKVKSDIGKRIASKLYEVGGEIGEENLENITGYVVDKLINDKDISMEQFISDLKQTTGDTAVTTLVLSALGLGGDTYNQSKINEVIDKSSLSNEQKSALKNVVEKDNASLEEVQVLIEKTSKNQSATMQNNEILNNNQQVIQQAQQMAQNQNSQQISNVEQNVQKQVENQQNSVYNNVESEGVLYNENGETVKQNDARRKKGIFEEFRGKKDDGRSQTDNQEQERKSREEIIKEDIEYIRKPENHIKQLTPKQQEIKDNYAKKGIEVVFYDKKSIHGGYFDEGKIYANINNANEKQQIKQIQHENAHRLLRTPEINEKVTPIAEKIIENENDEVSEAIRNYLMQHSENISVEDLDTIHRDIVEEMLADYTIDIENGVDFSENNQYEVDENILNEYKEIIKEYLVNEKNSTESSFSLQENKSEGTKTYKEQVGLSEEITNNSIDASKIGKITSISSKSQKYKARQENRFKDNIVNKFGTSKYINKNILNESIAELEKEYSETKDISQETVNRIFEKLYTKMKKIDTDYFEQYKELKSDIRNTKLYVPENIRKDITDYNEFRSKNMGNLTLTNNSNELGIDVYYQELSSEYPNLFPDSIINPSDQLQKIAEVVKDISKVETNVQAYNDKNLGKEYKNWAKRDFEFEVNKFKTQLEIIDKYNAEKRQIEAKALEDEAYNSITLKEIKGLYAMRTEYRKEFDKVNSKELLTKREQGIVKRLLDGEMGIEEILPGFNKEAILKVYNAKTGLDVINKEIAEFKTRRKEQIDELNESLLENLENFKDKKKGFYYSRETAIRNIEDIMDAESAKKVNDAIFKPVLKNESDRIRFINENAQKIDDLEIDTKRKYLYGDKKINEADIAGLYIEGKISKSYLADNNISEARIAEIAKTFSEILEETVNKMEVEYLKNGYAPVERRKNYFPHFTESKADSFLSKITNALGIRTSTEDLPTSIAGMTDTFKPGRTFNRNILQRKTEITDIDALKAMEMYINGASDVIYHTTDIQKLRSFERTIREKYIDLETQNRINEIKEDDSKSDFEKHEDIEKIREQTNTPLPHFVTWLNEYTNTLANKKAKSDRTMEDFWGRETFTTIKDSEGKIASNMIGGNLSVALTNIAPLAQAMGTTKIGNILTGMLETTMNDINTSLGKGDNFVDASDFLTARRGAETIRNLKVTEKISNIAGIPMNIIDNFISESIVRAKYRENLQNGMTEIEALQNADEYTANLMADRRKGALPTLFNIKNPASKLITMFQVEPNNMLSNYTKDMKKVDNKVIAYAKLSASAFAFNTILKAIRGGSNILPDPISLVSNLVKWMTTDDEEEKEKAGDEIITDIIGSVPFGSSVAVMLSTLGIDIKGIEEAGRLPIQSAIPSISKIQTLWNDDVSGEYIKQVIEKELMKPLLYLGLPTGGAQINKTIQGLATYVSGGSYSYDQDGNKSIQFPVAPTAKNLLQASIFGKYATDSGKAYVEDFSGMNHKETSVYNKSNMDFYQLKDYFSYGKQKDITKIDKINYINDNMSNISTEDKWNIFEYNIISSTEREDGTSQLADAKYAIENNIATKEEYMKLYEDAEKNEVGFPDEEKLKELKENDFELKTYMKYKTEAKIKGQEKKEKFEKQQKSMLPISEEEQIKSKSLNTTDKINIIKQSKYTEEEKDTIYINEIGKEDDVYTSLKLLNKGNNRINDYLDYKTADLSSDKKDDGTKNGKTIRGSAEDKFNKYMNNSNFSGIERLYLRGTEYKLENWERKQLQSYVKSLNLTKSEQDEIYKSLSSTNVVEMKDGTIRWKN